MVRLPQRTREHILEGESINSLNKYSLLNGLLKAVRRIMGLI